MKDELREKLQDMSKASMEAGIPIMGNIITDAVIVQAVPGVATAVISYKQKRTERMLIKAIDELKKQMIAINEKVNNMDKEQITFIKEKVLPIVFDFVIEESQEEKIKYIINGAINLIEIDITDEDLILNYYDILSKLRIKDINILIDLYQESKKMIRSYLEETDRTIKNEYEAVETHIIKKMESIGLISVRKTLEDLEGRITKPKKSATDISKLGIYLIEFFKMYKKEDDNHEWRFSKIYN